MESAFVKILDSTSNNANLNSRIRDEFGDQSRYPPKPVFPQSHMETHALTSSFKAEIWFRYVNGESRDEQCYSPNHFTGDDLTQTYCSAHTKSITEH